MALEIVTYSTLPLSPETGFVQWVADATPLEDLTTSVADWLRSTAGYNPQRIKAYRERFNSSVAFYCVASLLLGLGDRHRGNMMLTPDGGFFHIDLEYALGEEARGKALAK